MAKKYTAKELKELAKQGVGALLAKGTAMADNRGRQA
jgi:hypothetical protein